MHFNPLLILYETVNDKLLVDGTLETIQNVIIIGKGVKNEES